jgi:hypothetical protein
MALTRRSSRALVPQDMNRDLCANRPCKGLSQVYEDVQLAGYGQEYRRGSGGRADCDKPEAFFVIL